MSLVWKAPLKETQCCITIGIVQCCITKAPVKETQCCSIGRYGAGV